MHLTSLTTSFVAPIPGYDARYEITRTGEVWDTRRGRTLKVNAVNKTTGYYVVLLLNPATGKREIHNVHRLLAAAFIPHLSDAQNHVDHIDRDRTNNDLRNLRWVTQRENNQNRDKSTTSSRYLGVTRTSAGHWYAQLTSDKTERYLGTYATERAAGLAVCHATRELQLSQAPANQQLAQELDVISHERLLELLHGERRTRHSSRLRTAA